MIRNLITLSVLAAVTLALAGCGGGSICVDCPGTKTQTANKASTTKVDFDAVNYEPSDSGCQDLVAAKALGLFTCDGTCDDGLPCDKSITNVTGVTVSFKQSGPWISQAYCLVTVAAGATADLNCKCDEFASTATVPAAVAMTFTDTGHTWTALRGDVNRDGAVDHTDEQVLALVLDGDVAASAVGCSGALDVNADGQVDDFDALALESHVDEGSQPGLVAACDDEQRLIDVFGQDASTPAPTSSPSPTPTP